MNKSELSDIFASVPQTCAVCMQFGGILDSGLESSNHICVYVHLHGIPVYVYLEHYKRIC